ncbi:hypothetical protein Val02_39610 [Virgisporangium aliadipatigenens]|uniref:Uncharacterized protein n=1 Tax=Virgisporangium aliadipatigenens TaxID=741659 RepID=A0A8J3YNG1_9ACTN|nr:hypothetical protein [Virgisporangium aliadipatigenens]GIJ47075.1 hypothetical protein Val02_39610 [Virgisporangium aliadipatigenens]
MTPYSATNVADGHAQVGIQAETVHGDIYYQLASDASPEERFRVGVRYLDARMPTKARELIEEAVSQGHDTDEVQFHRLLALLSGRTVHQLEDNDLAALLSMCEGIGALKGSGTWAVALRVVVRLLDASDESDADDALKGLDRLPAEQRNKILDHLGVLLDGTAEDQMWYRSALRASEGRMSNDRADRIWMFFHPAPAPPRVRRPRPEAVSIADRFILIVSAAALVFALGGVGWLNLRAGGFVSDIVFVLGVAGFGVFVRAGAEHNFRQLRVQAKDRAYAISRAWRPPPVQDGFTRRVDRSFDRYFNRYVPNGADRAMWLAQTAGIRWNLRDEVVEVYREARISADRVDWLIRHLVSEVRRGWENGTLLAHRDQLRTPPRTRAERTAGLVVAWVAAVWVGAVTAWNAPLGGTLVVSVAVIAAIVGVGAFFRTAAERWRAEADAVEATQELAARTAAFDRWAEKLSRKPSDAEMAFWLDCDRRILVNDAMTHYRLSPSQVIAHAFIEAPGKSYKRARVARGPWRYSRYAMLLFLLTRDGVRQVNIDLDFLGGVSRGTQRLNYRFDAVAAVRIDGLQTPQQTFELTLVNGEPIKWRVTESSLENALPGEDARELSEVALDASGLVNTLNVLEGIAAEGKHWIVNQRDRAHDRLAGITAVARNLTTDE